MDKELRNILKVRVNVRRLIKRLAFTEETAVDAALSQAKLYKSAAVYRVQKLAQRVNAETNYDMTKAQVANIKRARIDKKNRTETEIKDLVARNPKCRAALEEFNQATIEEQFAKMLVDSYDQRMQSLHVVAKLVAGDYSVERRMRDKAEELGRAYENIGRKYDRHS